MDIRTLRQKHGIKLKDLANMLEISSHELSKYERGLVCPPNSLFSSLSDIFRVDVFELRNAHELLIQNAIPGEGYTTAKSSHQEIFYSRSATQSSSLKVMDLFCGTGGFSYGFEQTQGFEVVLGLDLLSDRAKTFSLNHPTANVIVDDIRYVSYEKLTSVADKPDVIIGGPPCQGFSSIRPFRTLTEKDSRNNLYESYALVVNYYKPKWFVLENVVGLLTHEGGKTLNAILQLFEQTGYTVSWKILNAAFYGLPQRRERLIIIGNRHAKSFQWPKPTHYFNGRSMAGNICGQKVSNLPLFGVELQPAITIMEAIHDLPEIRSGEFATEYRKDIEITSYENSMRSKKNQLTLHEATKHSPKMLNIIRNAGHNRHALPMGLTTSGFSSSYSRLEPDMPSVTLTVNFVHPASNKCIHPYQDRALTPREGARLQGFDDDYVFIGSRAQVVKQIGNAVPPILGKIIAQALLEQI
ncbi:DNA (cytosine-5-)-methyltransferase [Candidatus Viridilinea mediisalina]|uniref:Cytosine-specific methyltransferase n=1 Tax=Candidatus Viridilinea mediisalina TaxID=2024553 RepID=A0A2A6REZ6_9CHLR|nr:DNA (cytosine-5-)-methyltransferase [Candidatus Viridilinea mediisalina]PDW01704.1 hypothetical protein CJ255_17760 [Candidatus Viridilinea mediisalina]